MYTDPNQPTGFYQQPVVAPQAAYYPNPYGQPHFAPRPTNGLAIAGFILSLLGIGFLIPLIGWLALPFVIIGLILSIVGFLKARRGAPHRGLGLAGIIIAAASLLLGLILNVAVFHSVRTEWTNATPAAVAPAGPQAEALVGRWSWEGSPWLQFNADGTGENLSDGERFNWHENGTFSNAIVYQSWRVDGDVLTVTWTTGATFTYHRM